MNDATSAPVVSEATVPTADGPMRVIIACPPAGGPFPAVITYPHIGGLTNTMRIMARRVAAGGFLCVVVDLYHRLGTIVIDPESTDKDIVAISRIAATSVTEAGAMTDTQSLIAWLDSHPEVRGPCYATVGYGRGGALAVQAASHFPDRIRAAASILGFGFTAKGEQAARESLARIQARLYFAFAEHDEIIPRTVCDELAPLLRELNLDARLVIHPGTRHPYVFPDRTVHDAAAASRDWRTVFAMFTESLAGSRDGEEN